MLKRIAAAVTILGYLGSVNAQEEAVNPVSAPIQSAKEAKGKKAVPERGNEVQAQGGIAISTSLPAGNPMLTLGQKKIEKKAAQKPAGEAEKKTAEDQAAAKNTAMFGLGYCTTTGIQLHVEVQKDDIKRSCMMNLPNLFFCIPAALREKKEDDEKTPIGINEARFPVKFLRDNEFIRSPEERIDLSGTQFLGLVDLTENPNRR